MKEKNNNNAGLLILITAFIAVFAVLTWIVPAIGTYGADLDTAVRSQVGLSKLFTMPIEGISMTLLYQTVGFILAVGGFYGVLKATGIYEKLVNTVKEKFLGKEKLLLIVIMILVALISTITGLELGLLFIFPILIAIILALGYDKIVAISATAGATLIGMYGSIFAGNMMLPASNLGLGVMDEIIARIVLFVLGLGVLIFFTLTHAKKNFKPEVKVSAKKDTKEKVKKEEVKEDKKSKRSIWPAAIFIDLVLILFVLGTTVWGFIFNVETTWFDTIHTKLMEVKVFDTFIFAQLFDGFTAFGTWALNDAYLMYTSVILITTIVLAVTYKVKIKDAFAAFIDGAKDFLMPAVLTILAFSVLVFAHYFPIGRYVGTVVMNITDNFNLATASITTMLTALIGPDFQYYVGEVLYYFSELADKEIYPLLIVMVTSLHSLVMLVAPTGIVLLNVLAITDEKYSNWLKFIWKVFLVLLGISLAVLAVLWLI